VSYQSSPIKRQRRTKAQIQTLRAGLREIASELWPATLRQLYYQATVRKLVDKTEAQYDAVGRQLVAMRRAGEIPYSWIADNTRWMRKPRTYSGLKNMLVVTQQTYRRAIWDTQDAYVEIWLEKEALAGVLYEITARWDVPLMVTRGYPSTSFLYEAAEAIQDQGKPAYLYYFGDHDPSGVDISRDTERRLREFCDDRGDAVPLHFERVAVNRQQIIDLDLPTRPTKKTDSRSKSFEGESVEVDAIRPDLLREMVEARILRHIDHEALQRLQIVEAAERETLGTIIDRLRANA
jgi:hypothetical protein